MKIKIDNREHELIRMCKYYLSISPIYKDIELVVEVLPLGDIIICDDKEDKLIIERKSLSDLSSSIKDGRYEEQSYRLNGISHPNHKIENYITFAAGLFWTALFYLFFKSKDS